jgi:hypothetical protein
VARPQSNPGKKPPTLQGPIGPVKVKPAKPKPKPKPSPTSKPTPPSGPIGELKPSKPKPKAKPKPKPAPKPKPVRVNPAKTRSEPKHPKAAPKPVKVTPTRPAPADSVVARQRKLRAKGDKSVKVDGKHRGRSQLAAARAAALARKVRVEAAPYGVGGRSAREDKRTLDFLRAVGGVGSPDWNRTMRTLGGRNHRPDPLFRQFGPTSGRMPAVVAARMARAEAEKWIERALRRENKPKVRRQRAQVNWSFAGATVLRDPGKADPKAMRVYLFDPEFGVWSRKRGETKEAHAKRVVGDRRTTATLQRYLKGHGHGTLKITGKFDKLTSEALRAEMREMARVERRQGIAAVKRLFFETGVIRPTGARDAELSVIRVGKGRYLDLDNLDPAELYDLLQRGDGLAKLLALELGQRLAGQSVSWAYAFAEQTAANSGRRVDAQLAGRVFYPGSPIAYGFEPVEKDLPFWKDALNGLKTAGNAVLDGLEWVSDEVQAAGHFLWEWDLHSDPRKQLKASYAAVERFEREHPVWAMVVDLVADPTLLIPGRVFLAPFQGAARAVKAANRVGEAWQRSTATGRIAHLPQNVLGHGLTAPYKAGRLTEDVFQAIWRDVNETLVLHPRLGQAAKFAAGATKLKSDVIQMARVRASAAVTKAAVGTAKAVAKGKAVIHPASKLTAEQWGRLYKEVDDFLSGAHLPAELRDGWGIRRTLVDLSGRRVSLYSSNQYDQFSVAGHHLYARLLNAVKAREVFGVADDIAHNDRFTLDEVRALLRGELPDRGVKKGGDDRMTLAEWMRSGEISVQEMNQGIRLLRDEWLEGAPLHLAGVGDPRMRKLLDDRIEAAGRWIRYTVMPRMQTQIERALPDGERFWDELGNWVGSQGAFVQMLKEAGRQVFARAPIRVRNPMQGKVVSTKIRDLLVEHEVAHRVARIEWQRDVDEAAGKLSGSDWQTLAMREERAVTSHWKQVGRNKWVDTRTHIEVPAEYALHLQRAAAAADPEGHIFSWFGEGPVPDEAIFPHLEDAAQGIHDTIFIKRRHYHDAGRAEAERQLIEEARKKLAEGEAAREAQQIITVARSRSVGSKVRRALAAIDNEQEAIRHHEFMHELAANAALWQALRHAQSRPLRALYFTAAAGMGVWRFFTLPLRPGWVVRNVADNWLKVVLDGVVDPRAWIHGEGDRIKAIFDIDYAKLRASVGFIDRLQGTRVVESLRAAENILWSNTTNIRRILSMYDIPYGDEFLEATRRFAAESQSAARPAVRFRDAVEATPNELVRGSALGKEGDYLLSRWHPTAPGKVRPGRGPRIPDAQARANVVEHGVDPNVAQRISAHVASFHDRVWDLMGNHPEAYFKRVLYRHHYYRALKRTGDRNVAHALAWRRVEKVLFDYSQISVIEDNFRFFFPFIQFWRKNFTFWVETSAKKPWFLADLVEVEQDLMELRDHEPPWMRRYIPLKELSDIVERVPGLGWMAPHLEDARLDPYNFFSFAPLYRAFKAENPLLPPEKAGLPFISGFVDAMNEWGLSMNPLVRKPLEWFGVLNLRTWQDIFPQTSLIEAFTAKYWEDRYPDGLNLEHWLSDKVLEALGSELRVTDLDNATFNRYVQMEMAAQALRDEPISRSAAEEKIRDFLLAQTMIGFFAGSYVRRMTPEDVFYSQLSYGMAVGAVNFLDLTPEQRALYRLWKQRGFDAVQFDRYVELLPLIRSYYQLSYLEGQELLKVRPELIPFVENWYGRRDGALPGYAQQMMLLQQNREHWRLVGLLEQADLPHDVEEMARNALVTPELQKFWDLNDTPHDVRSRMIRGVYHAQMLRLQKTYYSIPEGDFEARQEFLRNHPSLARWWQTLASGSDDYRTIYNSAASAFRERYFEIIGDNPTGENFERAIKFLQRFPWIFEPTAKAAKYRRIVKLGHYPGYTPGGFARGSFDTNGPGLSQHARDYLAAKRWLDHYFSLPKAQRDEWLRSGSRGAQVVREYFGKYADRGGKPQSQHARDYLKAKKWLDYFFSLPKDRRNRWLNGRSAGAKVVRRYFRKYADPAPQSQKARDFLRAKQWLDYYFSLPEAERVRWLRGTSKGAMIVRGYFDKYAESRPLTEHARDYLEVKDLIAQYFKLPPEARGAFLDQHPELEAYFDKYADERGQSQHAQDYLAIKPVLDQYFALPKGPERRAFLDQHPELRDYFAKYAEVDAVTRTILDNPEIQRISKEYGVRQRGRPRRSRRDRDLESSDPNLRRRLEFWKRYFELPPDERPAFVAEFAEQYGVFVYGYLAEQETHDKEQNWMREGFAWAEETERSQLFAFVRPLLNFYFSLTDPFERDLFLRANPELARYLELVREPISTGDPVLDALIEEYFSLPRGSRQRSILLDEHPELQQWFDENSEPQDAALHDLLDVYFGLSSREREGFLSAHPEVQEYFDKRREEKALERRQLEAFDRADPRLAPFFEAADWEIGQAAYLRKRQMLFEGLRPLLLELRRERKAARLGRRQVILGL